MPERVLSSLRKNSFKKHDIPDYEIGVYIDIFPLDKLPSSLFHANIIRFENRILTRLLQLKVYPKHSNKFVPRDIIRWLIRPVTIQALLRIIHKNSIRYAGNNNSNYVSNIVWPTYKNEILLDEWFSSTELADFEEYKFNVPKDYDKILRSLYGDYMKLPPVENRVNKHHFDAWIYE